MWALSIEQDVSCIRQGLSPQILSRSCACGICSDGPSGLTPGSDFYVLVLVSWLDAQYNDDGVAFAKQVRRLRLSMFKVLDVA